LRDEYADAMTDSSPKPPPIPKGGFREVAVVAAAAGFAVHLDTRPLKTPAGRPCELPTQALAEAVAAEWRAAAPKPPPSGAIKLTQMAATALDRIAAHRAAIEAQLLAYAETELLCHRADHPPELAARQQAVWQPLLDWLAMRHDALLAPTVGIIARPQAPASLAALAAALAGLDAWRLSAVSVAVAASGSLVIGLALADGRLTAEGAFAAAELDATFQIEKWGEDEEARRRRAGVRQELELAERFLGLLD
jgi:chaperone required for assembly of F1-ATPase